ncbi:hypothetical protein OF117_09725 [Geodermatophilus sp. YIM 151500]|uniref:hypothetical protein n=1 Tax=Geodermatophilus sp. YIM 151500 TaxID=2984531 RepID=UPI0021E35CE2|nr:hypothetical protein [Geodermatophilus sp. YIM 151500]MCV2489644.1 hypothetical protein [Geodermatophilus sp. YIM 151500]
MADWLPQLLWAVVAFAATAAGFRLFLKWLAGEDFLADRLLRRRRAAQEPTPLHRPLEAVAADVRRLGRRVAAVPAGAPMVRRRALWAAYDDVLIEAAELLQVPHALDSTPDGRSREVERLRLLAALEAAGLVVDG